MTIEELEPKVNGLIQQAVANEARLTKLETPVPPKPSPLAPYVAKVRAWLGSAPWGKVLILALIGVSLGVSFYNRDADNEGAIAKRLDALVDAFDQATANQLMFQIEVSGRLAKLEMKPVPPPVPIPPPDPPAPVEPTDTIWPSLKSAWASDLSPTKKEDRTLLAGLFEQSVEASKDRTLTKYKAFNDIVTTARKSLIGDRLAGVRSILNAETDRTIGTEANGIPEDLPMDDSVRAKAQSLLTRYAGLLRRLP